MKTPEIQADATLRTTIIHKLISAGCPAHLNGYEYLKTALELILGEPRLMEVVTTELYPKIAIIHDTTASRVERGMRHAIGETLDRNDPDDLEEKFGLINPNKGTLTNSEFLGIMAEQIRLELGVYGPVKMSEQECLIHPDILKELRKYFQPLPTQNERGELNHD